MSTERTEGEDSTSPVVIFVFVVLAIAAFGLGLWGMKQYRDKIAAEQAAALAAEEAKQLAAAEAQRSRRPPSPEPDPTFVPDPIDLSPAADVDSNLARAKGVLAMGVMILNQWPAQTQRDASTQVTLFAELGGLQFRAGDKSAAKSTIGQSQAIAQVLSDGVSRRQALQDVASVQAMIGDGEAAWSTLGNLGGGETVEMSTIDVAAYLANAGDYKTAGNMAGHVRDALLRCWAWQRIAEHAIAAGDVIEGRHALSQALEIVNDDDTPRENFLASELPLGIAVLLARVGQVDAARKMIDPVSFQQHRAAVLLAIAEWQQEHEPDQFAATITELVALTETFEEPLDRIAPLTQAAEMQVATDPKAAFPTVRALVGILRELGNEHNSAKAAAFGKAAAILARAQQVEPAADLLRSGYSACVAIKTPAEKASAMLDLAETFFAPEGEVYLAPLVNKLADDLVLVVSTVPDPEALTELQIRRSRLERKLGRVDSAHDALDFSWAAAKTIPLDLARGPYLRLIMQEVVTHEGYDAAIERVKVVKAPLALAQLYLGMAEGLLDLSDQGMLGGDGESTAVESTEGVERRRQAPE